MDQLDILNVLYQEMTEREIPSLMENHYSKLMDYCNANRYVIPEEIFDHLFAKAEELEMCAFFAGALSTLHISPEHPIHNAQKNNEPELKLFYKEMKDTELTLYITHARNDLSNFLHDNFSGKIQKNLSQKTADLEMAAFITGTKLILNLLQE